MEPEISMAEQHPRTGETSLETEPALGKTVRTMELRFGTEPGFSMENQGREMATRDFAASPLPDPPF